MSPPPLGWLLLGLRLYQPWDFFGRNNAKAETPVLWPPHAKSLLIGKDSDARKGLRAGGVGDDRGWDGWMASPTRWTWVWVNSRSWWWKGRPGVLQFMGSQRVRHDWATELNWTELNRTIPLWIWLAMKLCVKCFLCMSFSGKRIHSFCQILHKFEKVWIRISSWVF